MTQDARNIWYRAFVSAWKLSYCESSWNQAQWSVHSNQTDKRCWLHCIL